ncbi:hypothetical protein Tco_0894755 [Tanacetum coccineum]|uniref:Uncharacterized protein n=1 Tax=Tanacetum coccineum TaxID=301880 RepID=A0ABQ5CDW3_9ASTR
MENANPPPANNHPVLPAALHTRFNQELQDDEEVLNELSECENAETLRRERIINSFDRDDLAFECMVGFRKFTAYLDPFLPMNIISRKAYNTIMVLEGTGKNIVAIVMDVYVFVKSFTYITDFVVLEDIGEFIMSDMAEVHCQGSCKTSRVEVLRQSHINDLVNKKRKHADDIHDYFKANKRLKSSVQYEDHLAGTVLNKLVLEIFFKRHQGLGLDDHARTFSSLLLAEVEKRNLNPLKQMMTIEQLRQ